ncbi:hypothetical protein [Streptomyces sp. NPDC059247]|uniref:hypothetical protein n=1 Tax=Streptomyces sp. NPDC059247 TaxID=3346790 RepID=UPI0036D04067
MGAGHRRRPGRDAHLAHQRSAAADRIAEAVGDTPNPTAYGEKAYVTAFVARRFVGCGLLVDLSANPDGALHHPGQVCRRENPADPVAADAPLEKARGAASGTRARLIQRAFVQHYCRRSGALVARGGHHRAAGPGSGPAAGGYSVMP